MDPQSSKEPIAAYFSDDNLNDNVMTMLEFDDKDCQ